MSDSCFMCLINTNIKQCPNCNIRAHYKCWSDYLKNTKMIGVSADKNKIIICPQCRLEFELKTPNTRSKMKQDDKETVVYIIKNFLNIIEKTPTKEQKMITSIKLFDYVYRNIWFLDFYPRFKITVQNKLIELYFTENWIYCKEIYTKMFNEPIPLRQLIWT